VVYEVQYNRFKPKRGVIEMCMQATDTIQYNGTKLHITGAYLPRKHYGYLSPLVFVLEERGISLSPIQANTGNYQGFTCGWEIVDDELYLIRFSSRSRRVYKTAQIFGTEPIDDISNEKIREIERNYADDTTRMKAPWFTGNIIAYEWRAKDEQERNGWKFTFQEGMLVKKKRTYVWTPKRLKDYIED